MVRPQPAVVIHAYYCQSTRIVLQELRNRLGLTRPRDEYERLLLTRNEDNGRGDPTRHREEYDGLRMSSNDDSDNDHDNGDPSEILVARNDGTVCIGSITDTI